VGILADKRLLITGVITKDSIAFHVAEQAQREGASVLLTSFGRVRRMTERAAQRLPEPAEVLELDVNNEGDLEALTDSVRSRWGGVDGALHAIAFAPEDAIGGRFMTTPAASAGQAFQTSAFSLKALAAALAPLMGAGDVERGAGQRGGGERGAGGSIVGLDFDAGVAWPIYDWMGVAKAALESVSRYLARDLGPSGIRVNLVSAGPLGTVAARGIPGFERLAKLWPAQAPLGWDIADPSPVASAICFLLSDYARAITGEILHVDGGFHAVGAPGEV
jgi:enoyl-[acyl-carrier protein] reductase I